MDWFVSFGKGEYQQGRSWEDARSCEALSVPVAVPGTRAPCEPDDEAERVLPVEWIDTRPQERAFWRKGMFANQNSAGRLRQESTLDLIAQEFRISADEE